MTDPDLSPRCRLFVALPVSSGLAAQVAGLPRAGLDAARWNAGGDLHITLRFLGDTGTERLPEIEEALSRVKRPDFGVEVRGLDSFDNPRQAVLYARVESVRKMTALCTDITDRLTAIGFDFGMRPFVPHVTIARLNSAAGLENYKKRHEKQIVASWLAEEFHLMQSARPDEKGLHYRTLSRFPLTPY